jgi:hypothetical protein
MENDRHYHRLIASARQIMDVPEQDEISDAEDPLYLNWFALGHAAVLLYLGFRALRIMTPLEQALLWSAAAIVGLSLAFLLRSKVRTALAMAEAVAPAERRVR